MGSAERATAVAIECLSLWLEPGEDARIAAAEHITNLVADPDVGPNVIIPGLLNLGMFLAHEAAKQAGASTTEEYRTLTRGYLQAYGAGVARRDL